MVDGTKGRRGREAELGGLGYSGGHGGEVGRERLQEQVETSLEEQGQRMQQG
jgi:hypothetical protein